MSSTDTADTRTPEVAHNPQFPALDTMRAIGALGVVITHVGFWAGIYTSQGYVGVLVARADVGVALFFVLSGFLLSRPWLSSARMRRSSPGTGRYFWKRALRIIPIYVITAVIALALLTDNQDRGPLNWVSTLLMLNIYLEQHLPAGLTQMWSLATEVAFYLVLPLLMWLVTSLGKGRRELRTWRVLALVATTFVITIGWQLSWSQLVPGSDVRPTLQWLPAMLNWFGIGIAFALLYELGQTTRAPGRIRRAVLALAASPGVCWTAAAGVLLIAATPLTGPTMLVAPSASESLTKNLLYAAFASLMILPGIFAAPGSTFHRVMSQRLLRRLGHVSYGLFCLHLPILHFVMWIAGYELFQGHFWQILALTLALSVAAAELAYRWVEEPFMRLKGWRRRPSATPAESTAPSTSNVR